MRGTVEVGGARDYSAKDQGGGSEQAEVDGLTGIWWDLVVDYINNDFPGVCFRDWIHNSAIYWNDEDCWPETDLVGEKVRKLEAHSGPH